MRSSFKFLFRRQTKETSNLELVIDNHSQCFISLPEPRDQYDNVESTK